MKPVFNLANRLFVLEHDSEKGKQYSLSNRTDKHVGNFVVAREQKLSKDLYRYLLEEMGGKTYYRNIGTTSKEMMAIEHTFFDNLENASYMAQRLIEIFDFSTHYCNFFHFQPFEEIEGENERVAGTIKWYGLTFNFVYTDQYHPEFSVEVTFQEMNRATPVFLSYLARNYPEQAIDKNVYCFKNLWQLFEIISDWKYSKRSDR